MLLLREAQPHSLSAAEKGLLACVERKSFAIREIQPEIYILPGVSGPIFRFPAPRHDTSEFFQQPAMGSLDSDALLHEGIAVQDRLCFIEGFGAQWDQPARCGIAPTGGDDDAIDRRLFQRDAMSV
nr:hypothetical protein [Haematobacter sp. UBA3484]